MSRETSWKTTKERYVPPSYVDYKQSLNYTSETVERGKYSSASEIRRERGEALLTEQALFFGVFQVCEGKCLASEERQTSAMGKGACLVSGAPRSLRVCLCSTEKRENITPVLEAMGGETWRKGRNNIFPLRDISSRVTRVFPSLCHLCGKRLATRSTTYPMELCLVFKWRFFHFSNF